MKTTVSLLFVVLATASVESAVAQPRLVLEAEDLAPRGVWRVEPWEKGYFCATFANDFVSRQAFLCAPEQCPVSQAAADFTVPEFGEYALFARYACPYLYNATFSVRIEQRGRIVFARTFGKVRNPKMWPFGGGIQPMASYPWGGGDNMVWEGDPVAFPLRKGPARIVLTAGPQDEPAAQRQVDVFLLTPLDEEVRTRLRKWRYLPLDAFLTQRGDLAFRVTNPRDGLAPLLVELTTIEHSPYWVHGRTAWRRPLRIGAAGVVTGKPTVTDYLAKGRSSPWIDIGDRVDRLNESTLKAVVRYESPQTKGTDAVFEFATPLRGGRRRVVKRVRYTDATTRLIRFAVPGNVPGRKPIKTAEEELEALLRYARSLPDRGKPPEFIGIRGVFTSHFVGRDSSQRVKDLAAAIRKELIGDADEKGIHVESLGDEIGLRPARESPEVEEKFRHYLRGKGVKPEDLLSAPALAAARQKGTTDLWSLIHLNYKDREAAPRLWYHSQVFGYQQGSLLQLKEKTEKTLRESRGALRTGANYSPHPYYWPKVFQWVTPFKLGALTMPWSEDYVWGTPVLSPQIVGYLMDVFRCAAKYHDLPICFYVMPHAPGNTPRDFRLSYYEALAHGAKLLNHFCVTPIVTAYTENYVAADYLPMYKEIHDLAYELGTFDDLLFPGSVRPAQVAFLLSGTADLCDSSVNYNQERTCLYYALRHAGIPVDFVTEEDVVDGPLRPYRVLYLCAGHLRTDAAAALRAWVRSGGWLFASAGGGLLNEYGEPNETMLELFGLKEAEVTEHEPLPDPKQTLPRARPVDGVRVRLFGADSVSFAALGTTQRLVPLPDAQVVAWFHDNSPAAVLHRLGQGCAFLVGALPGAAYIASAVPVRPWDRGTTDEAFCHFLPADFDASLRSLILWPVRRAGVTPPVALSRPVVEWSLLDSRAGTALMLLNWTGKPIPRLTVTVHEPLGDRSVVSVAQGPLTPQQTAGGFQLTLPLDVTDCLTFRSKPRA